jgi:hypothetical protein
VVDVVVALTAAYSEWVKEKEAARQMRHNEGLWLHDCRCDVVLLMSRTAA